MSTIIQTCDDSQSDCERRERDYQVGQQQAARLALFQPAELADLVAEAAEKRREAKGRDDQSEVDRWRGQHQALAKYQTAAIGSDVGALPIEALIQVAKAEGGFLAEYIRHNLETAYRQQPAFALAGGIALLGALTGRKLRDDANTRTNVNFVCVGPPGCGKDHARKLNESILSGADRNTLVAPEELTSDSAVAAILAESPCRLFQPDEIGRWLAGADAIKSPHKHALVSMLLKVYSSATSERFQPKGYADSKYNVEVNQPHLVVFGTSTPQSLYVGLGEASVEDGLLSRMSIVEATADAPRQRQRASAEIPEGILQFANRWISFNPTGNLGSVNPSPLVARMEDGVDDMLFDFAESCDSETDSRFQALWCRAEQKARQYAVCFAAARSDDCEDVVIDELSARWGIELSRSFTDSCCEIVNTRIARSVHESMCQDVYRAIRPEGSTMAELARTLRKYTARQRLDALGQLQSEGRVELEASGRATVVRQTSR